MTTQTSQPTKSPRREKRKADELRNELSRGMSPSKWKHCVEEKKRSHPSNPLLSPSLKGKPDFWLSRRIYFPRGGRTPQRRCPSEQANMRYVLPGRDDRITSLRVEIQHVPVTPRTMKISDPYVAYSAPRRGTVCSTTWKKRGGGGSKKRTPLCSLNRATLVDSTSVFLFLSLFFSTPGFYPSAHAVFEPKTIDVKTEKSWRVKRRHWCH